MAAFFIYITLVVQLVGEIMGYPTKVQRIKRKNSEQWYIGIPAAVAKAMGFLPSEEVEWHIERRDQLVLTRKEPTPSPAKKKRRN